jgi:uncharacterized protein (UPF0179 family)
VEDGEFTYIGPINECRSCKLKTVCFNLKIGRTYKITKVRDKKHNCNVHEGKAVVVEVQELPIIASIDKKLSEGSITKIEPKECKMINCDNYDICHSNSIQSGKKYRIVKIYESLNCPLDYDLKRAELVD